jgi:hypothetical protein
MQDYGNAFIRKSSRIPLKLRVLLTYQEKEIEATTHDISSDGMFIEPKEKLEINVQLNCSLFLPENKEPLSMTAKVRYDGIFTYTGKDTFYGAGLYFTELTDDVKKLLKQYLEKQFYQCKNFRRPRKSGKPSEDEEQ